MPLLVAVDAEGAVAAAAASRRYRMVERPRVDWLENGATGWRLVVVDGQTDLGVCTYVIAIHGR